MGQILCQVRIPHRSLIGANDVVNTFNFTGIDNVEDQATVALGLIKVFYNDLTDLQTSAVKNYLSGELNPAGTRIKIYDASDPEPRVPILDESLGVTGPSPASTTNLPGEVAVGLSYTAAITSGVPAARRRGRIYLGPLNAGATEGVANAPQRPSSVFMLNLSRAAKGLSDGPIGTRWAVYSRRDDAFRPIVAGYVDNAFDTQRRRGVDATARIAFESGLG